MSYFNLKMALDAVKESAREESAEEISAMVTEILSREELTTAARSRRMFALAARHGHEWASALQSSVGFQNTDLLMQVVSRITDRELVRLIEIDRNGYDLPGGIWYYPESAGDDSHTTGTGRLAWVVREDGGVCITLCRPTGVLATVIVAPDGAMDLYLATSTYLSAERFGMYYRHSEALLCALNGLVECEPALEVAFCRVRDAVVNATHPEPAEPPVEGAGEGSAEVTATGEP